MAKSEIIQAAVIMGSKSDWETMRPASETLTKFGVAHECRVLSAHRTPEALVEFLAHAENAAARCLSRARARRRTWRASSRRKRSTGIRRAHREQMCRGWILLSTCRCRLGIPCTHSSARLAPPMPLLAVAVLALQQHELAAKLQAYRAERAQTVLDSTLD